MAGPISTIISEIVAAFPADWQKTDQAGGIIFGSGGLQLAGSPPRTAWVLGREPVGPPETRKDDRGVLWVRRTLVDLYLWGADIDAVEEMIDLAIRAIHLKAGSTVYGFPGGAVWTQAKELIQSGVLYVLPVELKIPVRRVATTEATPTSLPTTMQLKKGDGTFETSHVQQVP